MTWTIVILIVWFLIGFLVSFWYAIHDDNIDLTILLTCVLCGCIGIFGALMAWAMFGDFDIPEIIVFRKREKK